MLVHEHEARKKACTKSETLIVTFWDKLPFSSKNVSFRSRHCLGAACLSYWRWNDKDHIHGYCSLGGKPEH